MNADRIKGILHAHYAVQQKPHRVFHEVLCGPQGSQRIDTWVLSVTWTRWEAHGFEVKVSRSDFLRDLQSGKWQGYLPHCSHFSFAAPPGVVKPDEVPQGVGLVLCGDGEALRFARRPAAREWSPDPVMLAATLFSVETPCFKWRKPNPNCQEAARRVLSVREAAENADAAVHRFQRRREGREIAKTLASAREILERNREKVHVADRAIRLVDGIARRLRVSSYDATANPDDFLSRLDAAIQAVPRFEDRQRLQEAHSVLGRLLGKTEETP